MRSLLLSQLKTRLLHPILPVFALSLLASTSLILALFATKTIQLVSSSSKLPEVLQQATVTTLNVMAFNFAWNNQTKDNDRILARYIKNRQADVVGIPECGRTADNQIVTAEYVEGQLDDLDYPMYMKNYKQAVGQCVLSKYPIQNYEEIKFSRCGDCAFAPVIQIFSINHPSAGQIWFIVNHPDASDTNPPNNRVVELVQTRFAHLPVFIMGDFNARPTNANILALLETHNTACPITLPYSDHTLPCNNTVNTVKYPGLLPGATIDYVFYPKNTPWQLTSGFVGKGLTISDHYPVIGQFIYQQGPTPTGPTSTPTLTPSPTLTPTPAPTPQITILSPAGYVVVSSLQTGLQTSIKYYTDRDYTITNLANAVLPNGVSLKGKTFIKTANDDKYRTSPTFFKFTVDRPVTVYVAYDKRATKLPTWLSALSGFTKTSMTISTEDSSASPLKVYSKDYPTGPITITLGGNLATPASGANTNYFVIIAPL